MGSLCGPWCANQLKGYKRQGSKSHSLGVCALETESPEGREGYWCAGVDRGKDEPWEQQFLLTQILELPGGTR